MLSAPRHRGAPDRDALLSVTTLPRHRPGQVVVAVVGEVDTLTAPMMGACLQSQARQRGLRELAVDLTKVTFLGAAGVTVLAQVHRRCRMRGARLVLDCGDRGAVLLPLQLAGLAEAVALDEAENGHARTPGPRTTARRRPPARGAPPRRPRRVRR